MRKKVSILKSIGVGLGLSLLVLSSIGQVRMSAETKAAISFVDDVLSARIKKGDTWHNLPIQSNQGRNYLSMLASTNEAFSTESLENLGVIVGTKRSSFVTLRVPLESVRDVLINSGLDYIQVATKVKPMLDRAVRDVRADSVQLGIDLPQPFTGKDVIIGITDWGFDYTHPMFYDTALQETRILAAWDQFKTSGPAPADYTYGTEYSTVSELLTAGSDTANIYSFATHGSHVAGIAGGSGAGTKYQGVAFDANYLFVTFLVDEAAVVDAFEWMYQKALEADKRLVVNMSWGLYYMGTLDGKSLLSEVIQTYTDLGVTFVTSAGNNGDADFHLKHDFVGDTLKTVVGFVPNNAVPYQDGQSITIWGEETHSFLVAFDVLDANNVVLGGSGWYDTETASTYTESDLVVETDTFHFDIAVDQAHPRNNKPHIRLRIDYPPSGRKIALKATAQDGTVHCYNLLETTTGVGNTGWDFKQGTGGYIAGDNTYGIGEPACSEAAISIGAYASGLFINGEYIPQNLANFSSIGPTLDGRIKPDISAPGVNVASSISSFTDGNYTPIATVTFAGRDYGFVRFSGTSMSSPMVTGIVALMLEANPALTPEMIKGILKETARNDVYTGQIGVEGDVRWGAGKVHAYRAVLRALELVGVEDEGIESRIKLFPNPALNWVHISSEEPVKQVWITSMDGTFAKMEQFDESGFSIDHMTPGTYVLVIETETKREVKKLIVSPH